MLIDSLKEWLNNYSGSTTNSMKPSWWTSAFPSPYSPPASEFPQHFKSTFPWILISLLGFSDLCAFMTSPSRLKASSRYVSPIVLAYFAWHIIIVNFFWQMNEEMHKWIELEITWRSKSSVKEMITELQHPKSEDLSREIEQCHSSVSLSSALLGSRGLTEWLREAVFWGSEAWSWLYEWGQAPRACLVTYQEKWLSVLTILNCSFFISSNGRNNRSTSGMACEEE